MILRLGDPVLVNGWLPRFECLADEFPGQIVVLWHSGWSASDLMREGKTLGRVLDLATTGKIRLLWLDPRDVLPACAKGALVPFYDLADLRRLAPASPPFRRRAVFVAVHGANPSPPKNILAAVAAACALDPDVEVHIGERTLGNPARGPTLHALLRGRSVVELPVLSRAETVAAAATCQLAIHPSLAEGFPFLPLEIVIAARTPCVITDAVAWADELPARIRDLCVATPSESSARIHECAATLMADPQLRAEVLDAQTEAIEAGEPPRKRAAIATLRAAGFGVSQ